MKPSIISELRISKPKPFGPDGRFSAIDKQSITDSRIWLSRDGLQGDEHADMKNHGGADKALHQYCANNYEKWRSEYPQCASHMKTGAFGENVVAEGQDETNVCIGDIFKIGDAVVQVSQGRQPCWKLNVRFEQADMARLVQKTGWTGWYYRILEEGWISSGDEIALQERPNQNWSLSRIHNTLYLDTLNMGELSEIAAVSGISDSWRALVQRRIENNQVENWKSRLGS